MKDNSFENIYIPVSFASSKFSKIVILAANKEYGKALDFIIEHMDAVKRYRIEKYPCTDGVTDTHS